MEPEDKTIYYKCLSFNRQSSVMHYYNSKATVTYLSKEWVFPRIKNSKLMVFNDYLIARRFVGANGIIVKCYIKKSKTLINCVLNIGKLNETDLVRDFWNADDVDTRHHWAMPPGTVFADAVYCLE